MAPNGNSFPAKITRWKLLDKRIEDRLSEMPHLQESRERLRQLIAEAEATQARFEVNRVAWRVDSERSAEITREAEDLRSRLTGALHYQFGPKNVELAEFGVKPRRAGRPKKTAQTPTPDPTPPQTQTPAKAEANEAAAERQG
jgi:hypothetical protein